MMARKNCVVQLEELLAAKDGNLIPLVTATKGFSLTARMLFAFPLFSLAVWCVGAFLIWERIYR